MPVFEFSQNVIPYVINELEEAEQYIRIAIFQLHHHGVFEILNQKLSQGLKVEILTLPYDSIDLDVREQVTQQFQELENHRASLYLCKWNIGDPERTTTAVGRWYSFHGKFIVTDKSAIALSANFTDQHELDAMLIYKEEPEKLIEFNQKFEELLELFVRPYFGYSGKIRSMIQNIDYPNVEALFKLPQVIETDIHKDHWILDYPAQLCPERFVFKDSLFILPFDVRGRNIVQDIFQKAKKYIYISTESFTDPDICNELIKAQLSGLSVKILTGSTSMDFTDRLQQMLRSLLASGINIHTTGEPLHAKLIVTDNLVAVSSINLNKMNLGFYRSPRLWRGNTETITLSSNLEIIDSAKNQFECIFDQAIDINTKLAERIEKDIGNLFKQYYGLRSKQEVKRLFSLFILSEEIGVKKVALKIGRITKALISGRNLVEKKDFVMALILHFLSDNKLKYNQIENKLSILNTQIDVDQLLMALLEREYIEFEDEYYKLQVLSLF